MNSIVYNPADSHILASAGRDNTLKLWDLRLEKPEDNPIILSQHKNEVTSLAFSREGKYLASGDRNGCVYVWNTENI